MNLRDQLLKAGLVSKKQVDKVAADLRRQDHTAKKNKEFADQVSAEKQAELEQIAAEKQKQQEQDKELNKQRDALVQQREAYYRARQLLLNNSLNQNDAQEVYYFLENNKIRKVLVNSWQREMLARGKLGIARPVEDVDEFVLIPLAIAKIIADIYPSKVLVLYAEIADHEEVPVGF